MAKLEITLQQDTPMWHFRPNEKGCCLRASEVKPKLDKFIIKKCKEVNITIGDNWKLKNQDKPSNGTHLDYKMSFEAIGKREIYCDAKNKNNFAPFFGNNCRREDEQFFNFKGLIYYPNGVKMTIFSLYGDLVEIINKYICEFFACHSFGTRQSKGFGCFSQDIPINRIDDFFKDVGAQYYFEIPSKRPDFRLLFKSIEYFHKLIRSGINEQRNHSNNGYYKSLMYHYVKSLNINYDWDKPQIRHQFRLFSPPATSGSYEETQHDYDPIVLYRDALGLSSVQSWRFQNKTITIKSNDENVSRFKSPIMYRPYFFSDGDNSGWIVYIFLDQNTLDSLIDKNVTFTISCNRDSTNAILTNEPNFITNYFNFIINNTDLVSNTGTENQDLEDIIYNMIDSFTKL